MRKVLVSLGLLALSACTGTQEERLPTLLAVGLVQDGTPQVALIETVLEAGGEYTLLEASRQTLAASAVAFDVTGRNGERGELVVLSRTSEEGFLDFFALRGINPEAPSAFRPVANKRRLTLSSLEDAAGPFCPEAVQVSSTGRYAAVFHGTGCDGVEDSAIDIIDVREEQVLERLTGGTFGLVEAPPYLDQRDNSLYFLQQNVSDANLIRIALPNLTRETFATVSRQDQVDIGSSGTNLLVLRPSELKALPLATPDEPLTLSTSSGARRLIDNLLPTDTAILILGNNRLTVHRSLEDEDEDSANLSATNGTLEAVEGFAYFPVEGAITRFDLLRYRNSDFSVPSLLRTFTVEGLTNPGPITFLKGILPEATP